MLSTMKYPVVEGVCLGLSTGTHCARAAVSCPKIEKLKFDARMAKAEAEKQHAARKLFLKSYSPSDDKDGLLLAFMEESVIEAEMERTRTLMALDQHAHKCPFCSPAN